MTTRYIASSVVAVLGGFLVVASQVFVAPTVGWLAFAIGIAALALAGVTALFAGRSLVALGIDGLLAVLGAWMVVASLVFVGSVLTWLSFAEGLGLVALAFAGLSYAHVRLLRAVPADRKAEIAAHVPHLAGAAHADGHRSAVAA